MPPIQSMRLEDALHRPHKDVGNGTSTLLGMDGTRIVKLTLDATTAIVELNSNGNGKTIEADLDL